MIIANGTIQAKTTSDKTVEFDEFGLPIEQTNADELGEPIECQYRAVNLNYVAVTKEMAPHTLASYEILIEGGSFEAPALILKDRDGRTVGEFSVVRTEPLDAVSQVRIIV